MGESANIQWRRPARCGTESTCVEVAFAGETVLVRNSQTPDGPTTAFNRQEWAEFVGAVKADEFNG